jgi:hypothetical protein
MDTELRIPGTRVSLGADSLLGLIPGIGDFGAAAVSLFIVNEARRLGVPNDKLLKMLVNVGFDTVAGSVPVVGDVSNWCSTTSDSITLTLIDRDDQRPPAGTVISNTAALS